MADTQILKILAQKSPSAAVLTRLYTSPLQARVQIKSLFVCNRSAGALSYRVAAVPNGVVTPATHHYIFYNKAIAANDSDSIEAPMFLNGGDYIDVYASSADLSFTLFGNED